MSIKLKQIRPHVDDCNAMRLVDEGTWSNPLFMSGARESRDSLGRISRFGRGWFVVVCNSTSCTGRWVVDATSLEDMIHEAMKGGE